MDSDQVTQCLQGPCDLVGVRRAVGASPCHVRAIIGLKPEATCPHTAAPAEPYFRTTPSGIVYSVPEPLVTHVSCDWSRQPGPEGQETLTGYGIIELPPGCTLHATKPDLKFRGPPATHNVTLRHVQISALSNYQAEFLNESFFGIELPPTALRLWTEAKQKLRETNSHVAALQYAAITAFSALIALFFAAILFGLWKACQAYKYIQILKGRLLATLREVVGHSTGPLTQLLGLPDDLRRRLRARPFNYRQPGVAEAVARAIQERRSRPVPPLAPGPQSKAKAEPFRIYECLPSTPDRNSIRASAPATVTISSEAQSASVHFEPPTGEDHDYLELPKALRS